MNEQAFRFNSDASYATGGVYPDSALSLVQSSIQVNTESDGSFHTRFPDVFQKYRLPNVSSDTLVQTWNSSPMGCWQNQVNFAVWCATTGCGVSAQDHLTAQDALMRALYRFHVYYQIRRILAEIHAPLPQDQAWSAFNNPYDRRAHERICGEFGISPHTDWRRHGVNHGLGKVYNYWTNMGYHIVGKGEYDSKRMSFTEKTTNEVGHVDYIQQDPDADKAWTTFVLDKSQGFTRPGVERLNDSIRTYVWAILGAQALTRTRILVLHGNTTAFDAQKQFLANVEDAISSPVDISAAIKRYQDVLQYAGSKVDYVFGNGLYMAPSEMLLRIGQVTGYNNEIVIAGDNQRLGFNEAVNVSALPADANAREKEFVKPPPGPSSAPATVDAPAANVSSQHARDHVDEKTALIVGAAGVGLLALWAFDRI